ncbi:uncharacterized protein LOC105434033 [Pogonomyrmex barbatus]|uniref:Uncharacterized protein LOC105434033 n=1 Tax=Pogonomyrmex barbatus TaxID=144034 RepID=A0A6I9WWP4_9HYME|nr:uncharacterized protein LOC105434033 [Pogonomyrmex barbatus]
MRSEEKENEPQDADLQTTTLSCISKMDFTLPKYRNNISPAIDKLMRMINMSSLLTSDDSSDDLPISTNRIFPFNYYLGNDKKFTVPILSIPKESLDVCFSSPKPFVSTYKRDAEDYGAYSMMPLMKKIESSLFQIVREPSLSEVQEVDPNNESAQFGYNEDIIYVSEVYFLLMASNRNRRHNLRERSRRNSKDSAFSEFMGSDKDQMEV